METLRLLLVVLHILGLAVIIGPFLFQVSRKADFDTALMRIGAIAQLVTGLALVGVLEAGDFPAPDHAKVAVKLSIGQVLLVLVMVNVRKERIPQGLWAGLLVLTAVNIAVAVFWSSAHA